ncbi:MAG: RNA 2',3'-cyclic phosphodiesterase [Thermodesulfobacteriota bacterium]
MEHIRAFIGIPLPPAYQDGLAALGPALAAAAPSGLGLTRPGAWHLTLKFLGDIPRQGPGGVEAVARTLEGVAWEGFALRGGGGGFFPGPGRPRVVYVGLAEGGPACRELAARVEAALAPLGVAPEGRAFTPHLTVARVRDDRGRRKGRGSWDEVAGRLAGAVWPRCAVDRFVLFRSVLGPRGPRYEVLREFLAGGGRVTAGAGEAGRS